MQARFRARSLVAPLFVAVIAGCSGPAAGAPTLVAPASQAAQSTAAATAPAATAPASTPAGSNKPTVDLTMSGWKAISMQGTAGQCQLGMQAGVAARFGFQALEADYPGLGDGLYISEGNNGFVTIKWLPNASTGFINTADSKGVSADHRSITIDTDLGGGPQPEHIKGTITCP